MNMTIEFYFDFISPYSYLASTRIAAFEQQHGIVMRWLPVNLPKLIHLSGNIAPGMIRNKALYSLRDLKRWALYLDVPFKMVKPGTFDTRPALRIAMALADQERVVFSRTLFHAIWSGETDMRDAAWLAEVFERHAELPAAWLALDDGDGAGLDAQTTAACTAGAFGAPTFMLNSGKRPEMYFGLDHMDFLGRACDQLQQQPSAAGDC